MRENYVLHKLHSLTGIVPVGFYMVQHLLLNSFALAGPKAYNGVIHFFESMPKHLLIFLKYGVVWAPLVFHAVYGLFIVARGQQNYLGGTYKYRENAYYFWQRVSGVVAFLFLCYHMASTSVLGSIKGQEAVNYYENWAGRLSEPVFGVPYLVLGVYFVGIVASSYHLSYGLWNFCIRWGITVSETAQRATASFAKFAFLALTLLGSLALFGFFNPVFEVQSHEITVDRGPETVPVVTVGP
jgi:succinate dehydrogenase / fumarate reductase cytochrome b subunit